MSKPFKLSSVMKNELQILTQIKEQGLLSGIALDVFEIISVNPGKTVGEIFQLYVKKYPTTTRHRNELAKRVNDLRNWGVVAVSGTVVCGFSGRDASMWVATGNLPTKTPLVKDVKITMPMGMNDHTNKGAIPDTDVVSLVSLRDRNSAIQVLKTLRTKSLILESLGRVLFFIPGLGSKNKEVRQALDVAL